MREIYSPVVLKCGWPRKDTELICKLCLQCSNLLDLLGEGVLGLRTGSSKMNFAFSTLFKNRNRQRYRYLAHVTHSSYGLVNLSLLI